MSRDKRGNRTQEVVGSIPISSTNPKPESRNQKPDGHAPAACPLFVNIEVFDSVSVAVPDLPPGNFVLGTLA